jgi:hypothetical protein
MLNDVYILNTYNLMKLETLVGEAYSALFNYENVN